MDFTGYVIVIGIPALLVIGLIFGIVKIKNGKSKFLLLISLFLLILYGYFLYKMIPVKSVPLPQWNKLCPPGTVINTTQAECEIIK
jgi:hypothetical protein